MARPGLTHHRKFRRLARAVGSDVLALGHLEWLWATAYEDGNDYLGDSDDVESAAHWTGAPGLLTQALATAGGDDGPGFLDEVAPGRYRIHDFWHHAPQYVSRRHAREQARKVKGESMASQCLDTGQPKASTPYSQHPAPVQKEQDLSPSPAVPVRPTDDGFDTFWAAYPKHIDKADALKAWRKLKPSEGLQSAILSAVADQRTWRTWADVKFVPNASTWLRHSRWDDERPADDRPTNRAPPGPSAPWCEHDPPCHHQQEHIARMLEARRAMAQGALA